MKRFMVMCTCLSLVMIVVGGIPQASAEIRAYEVVRSFGPIINGGAKSAKIVYCPKLISLKYLVFNQNSSQAVLSYMLLFVLYHKK